MSNEHVDTIKKAALVGLVMGVATPVPVSAKTLQQIVDDTVLPLLQSVTIVLFSFALLVFVYEIVDYIRNENHKKAAQGMTWSLVAMFVMVSVWGLVKILQSTLSISGNENITLPRFPQGSGAPAGS